MTNPPDDPFKQFEGLFEEFFGAGAGARPSRGEDLSVPLSLSLVEAAEGCRRDVEVRRAVLCADCKGSGAAAGSAVVRCSACEGRKVEGSTVGAFHVQRPCARCKGAGEAPERACPQCEGGRVTRPESIALTVPPGMTTGQQLRVRAKGGERADCPAGDLYFSVTVVTPPGVTVEGSDLRATLVLSEAQCLAGGEFTVPSARGDTLVRVPPEARDGQTVSVRGAGLPRLASDARNGHYRDGAAHGDLVVTLQVAAVAHREVPWRAVVLGLVALGALAAIASR